MRATVLAALAALTLATAVPGEATDGTVDVYPVGDSITWGLTVGVEPDGTYRPVPTPGGYRGGLHELLVAADVPHQFRGTRSDNTSATQDASGQTQHDGWGGYRVDEVAASLDGVGRAGMPGHWLTGGHWIDPDVVIVHLGTNDIGQRWDPATAYPTADGRADFADAGQRRVFVRHLADRLDALVDKLQALRPHARIVLSTAVPIVPASGEPCDKVTPEYARAVAELVAAERAAGEKVVLADAWAALVGQAPNGPVVLPGVISPDGYHPTPKGYSLMATVYRDAVLAALAL